jgi:hypothetical protein
VQHHVSCKSIKKKETLDLAMIWNYLKIKRNKECCGVTIDNNKLVGEWVRVIMWGEGKELCKYDWWNHWLYIKWG